MSLLIERAEARYLSTVCLKLQPLLLHIAKVYVQCTYNHSRLSLSTANLAVGLPALLQKTLIKLKITNKYGGITFKNYIFTKVINFPLKTIQITNILLRVQNLLNRILGMCPIQILLFYTALTRLIL